MMPSTSITFPQNFNKIGKELFKKNEIFDDVLYHLFWTLHLSQSDCAMQLKRKYVAQNSILQVLVIWKYYLSSTSHSLQNEYILYGQKVV